MPGRVIEPSMSVRYKTPDVPVNAKAPWSRTSSQANPSRSRRRGSRSCTRRYPPSDTARRPCDTPTGTRRAARVADAGADEAPFDGAGSPGGESGREGGPLVVEKMEVLTWIQRKRDEEHVR
ncbi:hypothetical protein VCV18_005939 [Metarhizium anisopliae]